MSARHTAGMLRSRIAGILAIATLCLPAPAVAQDGVFVDPDSPSGKEYQIPLESVRRQADPATRAGAKVAPGQRSAPLFGEGIDPEAASSGAAGPGGGAGGAAPGSRGSSASTGAGTGSGGGSASAADAIAAARSQPGAPAGGTDSTFVILGGAMLVLLAGSAAGLALRRSDSAPPEAL